MGVHLQSKKCGNALQGACLRGRMDIVKYLHQHTDIDINAQNSLGYNPLLWACTKGYDVIVRYLLQQKDLNCNLCIYDSSSTALMRACEKRFPNCVRLLLEDPRVDINLENRA